MEEDIVSIMYSFFSKHFSNLDVTKDSSEMMKDTFEKIKKIFGTPRNYGMYVSNVY